MIIDKTIIFGITSYICFMLTGFYLFNELFGAAICMLAIGILIILIMFYFEMFKPIQLIFTNMWFITKLMGKTKMISKKECEKILKDIEGKLMSRELKKELFKG